MTDLTPIGDVLVSVQAHELKPGMGAQQLRDRHRAVQSDFKRHRDPETLALQMAWLCLIAIERIRQMEESHAGDRDRPRRRSDAHSGSVGIGWRQGSEERTAGRSEAP